MATTENRAAVASALHAATKHLLDEGILPNVAAWDRDDELPTETLDRIVELGITGALVPVEHGGPGLGVADLVHVWRTLSQGWISITGAVNPTGLATTLLVRHGSAAQQAQWLPRIASGEVLASFSITEPQAGSDLKKLQTTARPHPDGGLVLDGSKRWVAGGRSSSVVFLMAGVEGSDRPSCVLLPTAGRGTASWRVDDLDKMGYRGVESAAYVFEDHHESGAQVLGGEEGLGRGARQMLDALDVGRVNVACRALGIIDRCLVCAVDESTSREIAGGVLGDHTHAQLRIGELMARLMAVEALVLRAAEAVDQQREDAGQLATAAKVVASDTAVWAVDRAARLAASRSYGADDELARLRRDAPQTQIGEGANDALLLALAKPLLT
ncbi:MAG: acyl-CoA dehydrogenase [Solirubrobacterales bacterium]|nr:acyl-CoA dehydrogenase [Solirubrobacterales bacterium]